MNIYYAPSHIAAYGGVERLQRVTHATKRATQDWLITQRTYTLHKPARKRYNTRPLYKSVILHVQVVINGLEFYQI